MTITWLGHSCFQLESGGFRALLDPYHQVRGLPDIEAAAHAVYCSHDHFDHGYTERVRLIDGKENPFTVTEVETFHDDQEGALRGRNTVRRFEAEGLRVVHLGDHPQPLSREQAAAIGPCDVVLAPVGGYYTISAHEARTLATPLFPRIIIPMHYRSATNGYRFGYDELGLLGNFTAVCPRESLVYYKGSTMEITKHTPGQTAILTYCPG